MLIKKQIRYLKINEFFVVRKKPEPVKKIPGVGQKRTSSATLRTTGDGAGAGVKVRDKGRAGDENK